MEMAASSAYAKEREEPSCPWEGNRGAVGCGTTGAQCSRQCEPNPLMLTAEKKKKMQSYSYIHLALHQWWLGTVDGEETPSTACSVCQGVEGGHLPPSCLLACSPSTPYLALQRLCLAKAQMPLADNLGGVSTGSPNQLCLGYTAQAASQEGPEMLQILAFLH